LESQKGSKVNRSAWAGLFKRPPRAASPGRLGIGFSGGGASPGGFLAHRLSSYVGRGVLAPFCIALGLFLLRSASIWDPFCFFLRRCGARSLENELILYILEYESMSSYSRALEYEFIFYRVWAHALEFERHAGPTAICRTMP
jgi:hypothetical protein